MDNPIRFTFKVFNTIPSPGGILRITAENRALDTEEFSFVAENYECKAKVQELDWVDDAGRVQYGSHWPDGVTSCRVSMDDSKVLNLRLTEPGMEMASGRSYKQKSRYYAV